MAAPQYMPVSRSVKSIFLGERKLAQPAYNPDTAQQYQQLETVQTNLGLFNQASNPQGTNILGRIPGLKVPELSLGWAPQIGHIKTNAATATRRRTTNPLLAPTTSLKSKNPFVISQTPSADLFGLNIPT